MSKCFRKNRGTNTRHEDQQRTKSLIFLLKYYTTIGMNVDRGLIIIRKVDYEERETKAREGEREREKSRERKYRVKRKSEE